MRLRNGLVVIALFTLGCTKLVSKTSGLNLSSSLFTSGGSSLNPTTDKIASDCATNSDFDTCLYQKNPVAQKAASADVTEAQALRLFGVKIRGLNSSGHLENSRIQVFALQGPRFSLYDSSHMKAPVQATTSLAEQISAYYWANRAQEYIGGRMGSNRLWKAPVKIYADDGFTGYVSSTNSIHLEKTTAQWSKAFSAEVVIQLLGQATAYELSSQTLFPGALAKHKTCGFDPRGCCASDVGCSQALASAFGDYMTAMMFPASARLGETTGSNIGGQTVCGISRDLASLAQKSKSEIFSACPAATGQAVLMGAWYASLWWKLRTQSEAQEPGSGLDIDTMFFDHAKVWNASSTFAEAKASALNQASIFKSGKYLSTMTTAFAGL